MENNRYDRLYVTPVLPYKPGTLEIDEEALRGLLRHFLQPSFVEAGGGIIINPVAGEIFYLTREEKMRVVRIAVEEAGGRVPVFAGAIDWTSRDTVEVARDAKKAGADGIFLVPPSGPSDITLGWDCVRHPEVWADLVRAIDRAVHLPLIAHPTAPAVPGFSSGGFALEPALKLCNEFKNIVGWKMTYHYEDYVKVAQGLRSLDHHVAVLAASSGYFHEHLANDLFDGTATGGWNYALEPMLEHIQAWRAGDIQKARRIWPPLKKLHGYVHGDKTHHHLKYKVATWLRGLIPSPFMRPPMPWPVREEAYVLRDLLQGVGIRVIGDREIEEGLSRKPEQV